MTLNNIIYRLQAFAESHKQVKHFDTGDLVEMLTNGDISYPACFLEQLENGGQISITGRETTFNFRIWFCDLADTATNSQRNEIEVKSDLTSICEDYVAMLNGEAKTNSDFNLVSSDFPVTYWNEKFEDIVIATSLNISISTKYLANRCQVPANVIVFPSTDKDFKMYDYEYIATGLEGNDIVIPILFGKKILLITREQSPIYKVSSSPDPAEYTWDNTTIRLGTVTNYGERFLILYRNY